jgi:hypothetical protein
MEPNAAFASILIHVIIKDIKEQTGQEVSYEFQKAWTDLAYNFMKQRFDAGEELGRSYEKK